MQTETALMTFWRQAMPTATFGEARRAFEARQVGGTQSIRAREYRRIAAVAERLRLLRTGIPSFARSRIERRFAAVAALRYLREHAALIDTCRPTAERLRTLLTAEIGSDVP